MNSVLLLSITSKFLRWQLRTWLAALDGQGEFDHMVLSGWSFATPARCELRFPDHAAACLVGIGCMHPVARNAGICPVWQTSGGSAGTETDPRWRGDPESVRSDATRQGVDGALQPTGDAAPRLSHFERIRHPVAAVPGYVEHQPKIVSTGSDAARGPQHGELVSSNSLFCSEGRLSDKFCGFGQRSAERPSRNASPLRFHS